MSPITKKLRIATIVILLFVMVGLIGWDVYAVVYGGAESTISQVILDSSRARPIIAFAMGVVCGHLFWPQKDE